MKITNKKKAAALEYLDRQGYSKHEAIARWISMSQKEKRKLVDQAMTPTSRIR